MQVLRRATQHHYRSTTLRQESYCVRARGTHILLQKIRPSLPTSQALQIQISHVKVRPAQASATFAQGLHETLECRATSRATYLHLRLDCGLKQSLPRSLLSRPNDALHCDGETVVVHRAQCVQTLRLAIACNQHHKESRRHREQVVVDLEQLLQSLSPSECRLWSSLPHWCQSLQCDGLAPSRPTQLVQRRLRPMKATLARCNARRRGLDQ